MQCSSLCVCLILKHVLLLSYVLNVGICIISLLWGVHFMYLENRIQTSFFFLYSLTLGPCSLMVLSLFSAKAPNKPIQVVYVPSHLFHMLFELFKVSGILKLGKKSSF